MADIDPSSALGPWQNFKPLTPLNYLDQALKMQQMQKYSLENAQTLAQQRALIASGPDAAAGNAEAQNRLFGVGLGSQAEIAARMGGLRAQSGKQQWGLSTDIMSQIAQAVTGLPPEQRQAYVDEMGRRAIAGGADPARIKWLTDPRVWPGMVQQALTPQEFMTNTGIPAERQAQGEWKGRGLPAARAQPPVPMDRWLKPEGGGPPQLYKDIPIPREQLPGYETPQGPPSPWGAPPMPGGVPGVTVPVRPIGPQSSTGNGAVPQLVSYEAQSQGVDVPTALATADLESKLGTVPDRRGSQYQGVFQLGSNEWNASGGGNRGDLNTQVKNGVSFLKQKQDELAAALGRDPQPWEIYLAHQQGTAGAVALLTNPDKPAGQVTNPTNIRSNGGNPNASASQFTDLWRNKFENAYAKHSTVAGQPAVQREELPIAAQAFPAASPETPSPGATTQRTMLPSTPGAMAQPPSAATPAATNVSFAGEVPAVVHPSRDYYTNAAKELEGGPQNWVGVGDSLAHGYNKVGGLTGTSFASESEARTARVNPLDADAVGGRSPQKVLDSINAHPERYRGKNVLLSTGVSNAPDQAELVNDQIAALKDAGAANVKVIGVGNQAGVEAGKRFNLAPYNAQIQNAVNTAEPTAAELARIEPEAAQPNVQLAAASPTPIPTTQPLASPNRVIQEAGASPAAVTQPETQIAADAFRNVPPAAGQTPIPGTGIPVLTERQKMELQEELKLGSDQFTKAADMAKSAESGLSNIHLLESAFEKFRTGKTGEFRNEINQWYVDMLSLGGFPVSKEMRDLAAAGKLIQVAGGNLAFDRVNQLGAREAVQVVGQVFSLKPNLLNTPEGNKLIVDAIKQDMQRALDRRNFIASLPPTQRANGFGQFDRLHPIEEYSSKVVPFKIPENTTPQNASQKLKNNVIYETNRGPLKWDGNNNRFANPNINFLPLTKE